MRIRPRISFVCVCVYYDYLLYQRLKLDFPIAIAIAIAIGYTLINSTSLNHVVIVHINRNNIASISCVIVSTSKAPVNRLHFKFQ